MSCTGVAGLRREDADSEAAKDYAIQMADTVRLHEICKLLRAQLCHNRFADQGCQPSLVTTAHSHLLEPRQSEDLYIIMIDT